jgi:hypothetical protein
MMELLGQGGFLKLEGAYRSGGEVGSIESLLSTTRYSSRHRPQRFGRISTRRTATEME